jgi:hypothetical protein
MIAPPLADIAAPPLDLNLRQFTTLEAAALSGASEIAVRNIEARVLDLDIGTRTIVNGVVRAIHYSAADIFKIRIAFYLCQRIGMDVTATGAIANYCYELARLFGTDPDTGRRTAPAGDTVLIAYDVNGQPVVCATQIDHPGHYLPPSFEDDPDHPLRAPHITIPVHAVYRNVIERVCDFLEARGKP